MTTWKKIILDGTETKYSVSLFGDIRNDDTNRFLKPSNNLGRDNPKGRLYVVLTHKGVAHRWYVHKLVGEYFLEKPTGECNDYHGWSVRHKEKPYTNNHVDNLVWGTHAETIEASKAKFYTFINPEGEKVEIYNMRKFCRDNNLDNSAMIKLSKGRGKSHRGWSLA